MQEPVKIVTAYQRNLFQRLDEFFVRATGKTASNFSTIDAFSDVVRSGAHKIAHRGEAAFRWLEEELRAFYAREGTEAFHSAQQLGGMKLVLAPSIHRLLCKARTVIRAASTSTTAQGGDSAPPYRLRRFEFCPLR